METKYTNLKKILTPREFEIARHLVTYDPFDVIAAALNNTSGTVRKHASNIYHKTGTLSRKLFRKKFFRINHDHDILEHERSSLEEQINHNISLEWNEESDFENYFIEFSDVLMSMANGKFNKKLKESDDKNSFLNFIAKGINTLSNEIQDNFFSNKIIFELLKICNVKQKIIILSKDNETVDYISILSDRVILKPLELKGTKLSELFIEMEYDSNEVITNARLNPKIFVNLVDIRVKFNSTTTSEGMYIYSLDLEVENLTAVYMLNNKFSNSSKEK